MDINRMVLILIKNLVDMGFKPGRTQLQKYGYFMLERFDSRSIHTPYYYGPFSTEVEQSVHDLVSLGLVNESFELIPELDTVEYPGRKYQYALTAKGEKVSQKILDENRAECEKVEAMVKNLVELVGKYPQRLINAAKIHYILKSHKLRKNPSPEELRNCARDYGWKIRLESVENGIEFLRKAGFLSPQSIA